MPIPWEIGQRFNVKLCSTNDGFKDCALELLPTVTVDLSTNPQPPEEQSFTSPGEALGYLKDRYPNVYIQWPIESRLALDIDPGNGEAIASGHTKICVPIYAHASDWIESDSMLPGQGSLDTNEIGLLQWHCKVEVR